MKNKPSQNTISKYKKVIDQWFVNNFNGVEACSSVYLKASKKTCSVNWAKIQKVDEIKEYIKEKHKEAEKKINITHEGILNELKNWLELDITDIIGLKKEEIKELPIKLKRLITQCDIIKKDVYNKKGERKYSTETIKLKFVSKDKAIDMINKHIGFYEKDNSQTSATINVEVSNENQKKQIEELLS